MNHNKYYRFHKDYKHFIKDCKELKEGLEYWIHKGYFKEFISQENHSILQEHNLLPR